MPDKYRSLMDNYRRWVAKEDAKYTDQEPIEVKSCKCPPREEGGFPQ